MNHARIAALDYHLPEAVLDNAALAAQFPDWSAKKILDKTGIRQRHIAAPHETAADLACQAAEKLFARQGVDRASIDFVILCTQAPDYLLPTSACVLQHRLGLSTGCGALDVNLGCSGFVYGLALAKGLIEAGLRQNVLLLTADTYTKFIHPHDRSVRTLFGDGAAATLVSAVAADAGAAAPLGPFVMGTDGAGAAHLMVPAGAMRTPRSDATGVVHADASGNLRSAEHLFMDGPEVMQFTLTAVPKAMRALLEQSGRQLEDLQHVVFHQANGFMLEALRKKLKIPTPQFVVEMEMVGNTVSSTIPIAIARARDSGRIRPGDTALLLGFGVGYSWAGTLATLF